MITISSPVNSCRGGSCSAAQPFSISDIGMTLSALGELEWLSFEYEFLRVILPLFAVLNTACSLTGARHTCRTQVLIVW